MSDNKNNLDKFSHLDRKFSHLDSISPKVSSIEDFRRLVPEINEPHLSVVRDLFKGYTENPNPEIVSAALGVIGQIDEIISLKSGKISGEIMKAANDENYSLAA